MLRGSDFHSVDSDFSFVLPIHWCRTGFPRFTKWKRPSPVGSLDPAEEDVGTDVWTWREGLWLTQGLASDCVLLKDWAEYKFLSVS